MGESQSFLLIGESNLARHVVGALELAGHPPTVLAAPDEPTLRHILGTTFDGIAVLTHDDVLALRYALSAAHWQPHTPLLATVFDHTVASRLREVLPQCVATSPADLAAPVLAGPCLADDILAACRHGADGEAVVVHDGVPRRTPLPIQRRPLWRSISMYATGLLRTPDTGTRMLLLGLLGVLSILVADWAWLVIGKHHNPWTALLEAVRVVTTVGPAPEAHGLYAAIS